MGLSPASTVKDILAYLAALGSPENQAGLARYGIDTRRAFGVPHSVTKKLANDLKRNHARALELFATGNREAQHLAAWTADAKLMTIETARIWAADFSSWDTVDGVSDLFADCLWWKAFIVECASDDREFVRRTAFAMMAWASIHRKKEPNDTFLGFLDIIERASNDDRNFVRKGVNWALRCIGKRSTGLHSSAITLSEQLATSDSKAARWIGRDALKDLGSAATQKRLARWAVPD
jgi:3-methyladenine DNA glycosylase AlkD